MVNIIEPSLKILTDIDSTKVLKLIENCGRTCYQSYENETEDCTSAKKMIAMLIKSGHESVLEHFSISIKMKVDVGVYKDLTRHRAGTAYSIESTRFCSYNKDKFGNELTFINPCNINYGTDEYTIWEQCMRSIETYYNMMAKFNCKADQLRMVLPHSTAAEVSMTANLRAWRHIFKMRCHKAAHPSVRQIMLATLKQFHQKLPVIFDDIYEMYKDDMNLAERVIYND